MARSLKNGRYSGILESKFDGGRGVTRGRDNQSGQIVALKWIKMISSSQIEETEEEARNLEMLSGGNQFIVQFVDFLPMERPDWFKLTSISFLVMEFCELGSLSDWIERRKQQGRWTSAEEVALIGAQIISALAFCHSRDIAHLDVKPQNVFIKGDGITIRVGDFGSVMHLESIEATIEGTRTDGVKNTLIYTPPESFTEPLRRSARLDVWGFGHIIQELLTFEHAFCRVDGRPTRNQRQIVNNICDHKRTKLAEIRGENEEMVDFEILLQKCLNPRKLLRPENALQLRGEAIFCEFLERIESGEAPNEIIAPPEEIIRRLRETNQQQEDLIEAQKRRIRELEAKLEKNENRKRKIRELKQICKEQQENEQKILAEIANLKQKLEKQEEDLKNISAENERKNQIEENLKIENRNMKIEIEDLKRELDQFKNRRQDALNQREQRGEFNLAPIAQQVQSMEIRVDEERRNELEKLRRELGAVGGAGHYFQDDRYTARGGVRNIMEENEVRNILKLLAFGEIKINLKFLHWQRWEVAENGWNLKFKAGNKDLGGDGWHHLWIGSKDGGVRFKTVVQEIDAANGDELSRGEETSEPDGLKRKIKSKWECRGCFVRYNITLL